MEINYKGVLCRLGTYRVNGEDKPTLYFISSPDDETMYKAGFEELHYGLWGKVLTDEEYKEITNREEEKDCKFYLVENNRLFCTCNNETFELKNNEWIKANNNEITERLMGYDSSEPSDSPYAIGNTDIMSSIKELTLEETIEKYGEKTIRKIKKISKEALRKIIMQDIKETLNSFLSEILSEMEKNKFKGDYKINSGTIEWKIQDDVKIIIYPGASGAGNDDVIYFYYKDPNGNEHMHDRSNDYPHSNITELLSDYNNSKFEIKEKGLLRKKYKLVIKRSDD